MVQICKNMAERLQRSPSLKLYYPGCKDQLSAFVRQTYDTVLSNNPKFIKKTRRAGSIEGFIYDLGHIGRGLDNFHELELLTPPPKKIKTEWGKGVAVEMPIADLLRQIATAADTFLQTHPWRQQSPNIFKAEISALNALAEEVGERKVKLTLTDEYDIGTYTIREPINEI